MVKPYNTLHHLHDLPEDILIDIFSRLPTKVVGQFRCLSKKWCTNLSTTHFIDIHSNRKVHQQEKHLLLTTFADYVPFLCNMPSPRTNTISILEKLVENTSNQLRGTCKGLVLLFNYQNQMSILVNPVTRQHLCIPISPMRKIDTLIVCDLGYDIHSKDYKIVRLTFAWTSGHDKVINEAVIDVYSVKMGIWKSCGSSPYKLSSLLLWDHGALLDGIIHWFGLSKGSDNKPFIASFDLADEVFRGIPVPPSANRFAREPFVHRGCLCILEYDTRPVGVCNLWMMKDYGVVDSWTKIASWKSEKYDLASIIPLALIGNDEEAEELLAIDYFSNLVMCDLKEQSFRVMSVDRVTSAYRGQNFSFGCTFVDSLVSPIQAAVAD